MAYKGKMLKNIKKEFKNGTLEIRWSPQFLKEFNKAFKDGELQKELTTTVLNGITDYVPYDTGAMLDFALSNTKIEQGEIIFRGKYVMPQYQGFIDTKNGRIEFKNYSNQTGKRGASWFDRYIEENEQEIINMVNNRVKSITKGGK